MMAANTMQKPFVLAACALAGLLTMATAGASGFADQRLFTTADQRAQLDAMRARMDGNMDDEEEILTAAGVAITDDDAEATRAPEPESPVGVRGFVQRSGGPPALWFDDDSGPDATDRGRIDGNAVIITLPDGRTVRLKPGQVYDPASGEVIDGFQR